MIRGSFHDSIQQSKHASMTAATSEKLIGLEELRRAQDILRPVAVRTPLLPIDTLVPGAEIYVKPEMLQRGGAFKFRGAYTFLSHLSEEQRQRGVIAPSSGNHAQAVALAAKLYGAKATVVMPETVTAPKRAGAERLGARVVLAGRSTQDRYERAVEIANEEGGVLVPPYDDPWIITGQGTAGVEIVEDLPSVGTVIVPVGGGGLSAGVSAAVKLMQPGVRVIGVEPAATPKLSKAREAGSPVTIPFAESLADGLMATRIGELPFAHHQAYIDEVITVDDRALVTAVRFLLDRVKLVTEPSGAITVAALMEGLVKPMGPTVAVLSGGNVEWEGLSRLLAGHA